MNKYEGRPYRMRAVHWTLAYAEGKPPRLDIMMEVPELEEGLKLALFFEPKNLPTIERQLRLMGWTGDDWGELAEGRGDLHANEVQGTLKRREYNGSIYWSVQTILEMENQETREKIRRFLASLPRPAPAPASARKESDSGSANNI